MKRSNLNVVGPPIKVFVERRVLDVVLWPPRIVMLSVMLPQDRLISTISSVCAKDPLYWLPRMPGPGRPTYSPYSVAIPNRAAPACCPQAVWPNTQWISSTSRLSACPSLQHLSEQGHEKLKVTSQLTPISEPSFVLKCVMGSPSGVVLYGQWLGSSMVLSRDGSQWLTCRMKSGPHCSLFWLRTAYFDRKRPPDWHSQWPTAVLFLLAFYGLDIWNTVYHNNRPLWENLLKQLSWTVVQKIYTQYIYICMFLCKYICMFCVFLVQIH